MIASPKSITKFRRATARRLRANQTGAELTLWRELRKLETKGTDFRRQVAIGPYVADLACLATHLVIELDGSHHADELAAAVFSTIDQFKGLRRENRRLLPKNLACLLGFRERLIAMFPLRKNLELERPPR